MRHVALWPLDPCELFSQAIEILSISKKGIRNEGFFEGRNTVQTLYIGGCLTPNLVISLALPVAVYSSCRFRRNGPMKSRANYLVKLLC